MLSQGLLSVFVLESDPHWTGAVLSCVSALLQQAQAYLFVPRIHWSGPLQIEELIRKMCWPAGGTSLRLLPRPGRVRTLPGLACMTIVPKAKKNAMLQQESVLEIN
jgi:hypothetical protein